MGLPGEFQGFATELEGLPGVYAASGGALWLATSAGVPAATIALRRLSETSGEVKRLYVRPDFRGHGLARSLLKEVFDRASALSYEYLYADTLPMMKEALSLYERLGFERIAPYGDTPTPGAIYLRLRILNVD